MLATSTKLEYIETDKALLNLTTKAEQVNALAVVEAAKATRLFLTRWYEHCIDCPIEITDFIIGPELQRRMARIQQLTRDHIHGR